MQCLVTVEPLGCPSTAAVSIFGFKDQDAHLESCVVLGNLRRGRCSGDSSPHDNNVPDIHAIELFGTVVTLGLFEDFTPTQLSRVFPWTLLLLRRVVLWTSLLLIRVKAFGGSLANKQASQ